MARPNDTGNMLPGKESIDPLPDLVAGLVKDRLVSTLSVEELYILIRTSVRDELQQQDELQSSLPSCRHPLMQYALPHKKEELGRLLTQLEKYRKAGTPMDDDYYYFDTQNYTKRQIFDIWRDIRPCLDIKVTALAEYIAEHTDLGKNLGTIRNYL